MAKNLKIDADSLTARVAGTTSKNTEERRGRNRTFEGEATRLNLLIPLEMKKYLTVRAAQLSIEREETVSLTQYFIELVEKDMKKTGYKK